MSYKRLNNDEEIEMVLTNNQIIIITIWLANPKAMIKPNKTFLKHNLTMKLNPMPHLILKWYE